MAVVTPHLMATPPPRRETHASHQNPPPRAQSTARQGTGADKREGWRGRANGTLPRPGRSTSCRRGRERPPPAPARRLRQRLPQERRRSGVTSLHAAAAATATPPAPAVSGDRGEKRRRRSRSPRRRRVATAAAVPPPACAPIAFPADLGERAAPPDDVGGVELRQRGARLPPGRRVGCAARHAVARLPAASNRRRCSHALAEERKKKQLARRPQSPSRATSPRPPPPTPPKNVVQSFLHPPLHRHAHTQLFPCHLGHNPVNPPPNALPRQR